MNGNGDPLELYRMAGQSLAKGMTSIKFAPIGARRGFWASISSSDLAKHGLSLGDFRDAPSFVVKTHGNQLDVGFICAKKREIVSVRMRRGTAQPS